MSDDLVNRFGVKTGRKRVAKNDFTAELILQRTTQATEFHFRYAPANKPELRSRLCFPFLFRDYVRRCHMNRCSPSLAETQWIDARVLLQASKTLLSLFVRSGDNTEWRVGRCRDRRIGQGNRFSREIGLGFIQAGLVFGTTASFDACSSCREESQLRSSTTRRAAKWPSWTGTSLRQAIRSCCIAARNPQNTPPLWSQGQRQTSASPTTCSLRTANTSHHSLSQVNPKARLFRVWGGSPLAS